MCVSGLSLVRGGEGLCVCLRSLTSEGRGGFVCVSQVSH